MTTETILSLGPIKNFEPIKLVCLTSPSKEGLLELKKARLWVGAVFRFLETKRQERGNLLVLGGWGKGTWWDPRRGKLGGWNIIYRGWDRKLGGWKL